MEFVCLLIAEATQKKDVKACYECKGAEACRPERLQGTEIRTSAILGAKNLYCYTVRSGNISLWCFHRHLYRTNRNLTHRRVPQLLVVLSDLVNYSTSLSSATPRITCAAMKTCATSTLSVSVQELTSLTEDNAVLWHVCCV